TGPFGAPVSYNPPAKDMRPAVLSSTGGIPGRTAGGSGKGGFLREARSSLARGGGQRGSSLSGGSGHPGRVGREGEGARAEVGGAESESKVTPGRAGAVWPESAMVRN